MLNNKEEPRKPPLGRSHRAHFVDRRLEARASPERRHFTARPGLCRCPPPAEREPTHAGGASRSCSAAITRTLATRSISGRATVEWCRELVEVKKVCKWNASLMGNIFFCHININQPHKCLTDWAQNSNRSNWPYTHYSVPIFFQASCSLIWLYWYNIIYLFRYSLNELYEVIVHILFYHLLQISQGPWI